MKRILLDNSIKILHKDIDPEYFSQNMCYSFSEEEISKIIEASNEINNRCLDAIDYVIKQKKYDLFDLPSWIIPLIEKSWECADPLLMGRLDLAFDGDDYKLLEFNADTPGNVIELIESENFITSKIPNAIQFNGIKNCLLDEFDNLASKLVNNILYFTCLGSQNEDKALVNYLIDIAKESGIDARFIQLEDIGWNGEFFTDLDENKINTIYKFYPWEWLINDDFGTNVVNTDTLWIEPVWKILLSKAILPILYQLFPDHKNILPAWYSNEKSLNTNYVSKPKYSRGGDNVRIFFNNIPLQDYENNDNISVCQSFVNTKFEHVYPIISSWIVGNKVCGLSIREGNDLITSEESSKFVSHIIE